VAATAVVAEADKAAVPGEGSMQRLLLFLIVAGLPASAHWRHFGYNSARLTGFFGAGISTPTNPVATRLDEGWNLAGGIGVARGSVGVMFDAMFTDFGFTHDALLRAGARKGSQKYWALTVDPIFHVNERGPVDFYVTGGGGLYSQITEYRALSGGGYDLISSRTLYRPGVDGGAGFAFSLGYRNNIKIFAEARYHRMFTRGSGASLIPVTVGVRF
jgi:hypothetical protein